MAVGFFLLRKTHLGKNPKCFHNYYIKYKKQVKKNPEQFARSALLHYFIAGMTPINDLSYLFLFQQLRVSCDPVTLIHSERFYHTWGGAGLFYTETQSNFYIFMTRLYWELLKTKKGQLSIEIMFDETWICCGSWNGRRRRLNNGGSSFHVWFISRCSKGGRGKEKKKPHDIRQEQDKSAQSHSHFISNLYCFGGWTGWLHFMNFGETTTWHTNKKKPKTFE